MNWKIIFQLSLFGLIMAFGTVSLIPQKIEPVFWLAIFIFCAYVIAKRCSANYFLNGFMVSIFNCVWIIAVHLAFYQKYTANHPDIAAMTGKFPAPLCYYPRRAMIIMGVAIGAASGIVLGLFAFVASKIVKR